MQTNWSYGRIAATTALILATLAVLFVLYRVSEVVIFAVLSIIFAAALRAPMLRLERQVRSRSGAILLLYALIFVVLVGGIYTFSRPLANEITKASARFPFLYDNLLRRWQASGDGWQATAAQSLPSTDEIIATIGENGTVIAYQLAGFTYNIFNILILAVAILTLTFYWLVDEDRFARLWLSLLPVQQRTVARQVWFEIEGRVGLFVRSEATQFLVTLVVLWTGLTLIGVPYVALWALYAAVAQLLPWIGVPLMLVPLIPMAFAEPWLVTLAAALLVLAVGVMLEYGIEPWFGTYGIIHPIVSVVALMMLGEVAGIVGMLIALPLAATIQTLLNQILQIVSSPRAMTQSVTSTQVQLLQDRIDELQTRLPEDVDQRRLQEGLLVRAVELLHASERLLREQASAPERRRMPRSAPLSERIPAIFARNRRQ